MELLNALPNRIAYFISGHGYGHAVRSARLINTLLATSQVTVYTSIERAFFERELVADFDYVELELDCGCVQLGALDVDIEATFERYNAINEARVNLLEISCAHLSDQGAELVIGDVPPLAFAAANKLNLPSLAISNFTWDEIYAEYSHDDPRFIPLLESIRKDYACADSYLRLYPGLPDHPFRHDSPTGMLCRTNARERELVAQQLQLDLKRKWCLIYIGEYGVDGIAWQRLKRFHDWQFLGLYPLPGAAENYQQIQLHREIDHADVLANCDLVLGKLGYGLVSECLYWGRPIAYTPRARFAEHAVLSDAVRHHGLGLELSHEDLSACNLDNALLWSERNPKDPYRQSALAEILNKISEIQQRKNPE